jgi:hypothetical protein
MPADSGHGHRMVPVAGGRCRRGHTTLVSTSILLVAIFKQRVGRELEMARAGGGRRRKIYSPGHILPISGINPDNRYNSSPS